MGYFIFAIVALSLWVFFQWLYVIYLKDENDKLEKDLIIVKNVRNNYRNLYFQMAPENTMLRMQLESKIEDIAALENKLKEANETRAKKAVKTKRKK